MSIMSSEYLDCYLRVSTTVQKEEGHSLKNQETIGKKVSKKLGLKFRIHNEGSRSSVLGDREVLSQIKEDIRNKKIKNLWVLERERLFRDTTDSVFFRKDFLEKFKINFYVGENGNLIKFDSVEDNLTYDLLSRLSQYENEKRIERSQSGKKFLLEKVSDKKPIYLGGTSTFGYDNINKEWVINKNESKWVKWIFKSIVDGKSVMEIKNHLDKNDVKPRRTKSNLWNLGTIQKMLRNESYTGLKKWTVKKDEKTYIYRIPQIISISIFDKVQKIMDERVQHSDNNKKHSFLLDGLLYCDCGFRMGSIHKKGKTSKGYKIDTKMYYCVSRQRKWKGETVLKECNNIKSLDVDKTNNKVLDFVKNVYSNSSVLKEKFKSEVLSQKTEDDKSLNEKIKSFENKGRRLQKEIENTINNISDLEVEKIQKRKDKRIVDKIISSLKKELDNLEKDYKQVRVDIEEINNEKEWVDWVSKYSSKIENVIDNKNTHREFLLGLLEDIQVHSIYGKNRDKKDTQVGHSLTYNFKMRIIDDKLIYKDKSNKNLGYEIIQGKKSHKTDKVDITLSRGNKKKTVNEGKSVKKVNCIQPNNSIHYSKTLNHCGVSSYRRYTFSKNTSIKLKINYKITKIKLNPYPYSQYQKLLIEKIVFLRKCGHTYKMISQYFNQINLLSYRGKKFSPSLVFELIKKHNRHLEKNKSKLGEIISSELVYE